MNIVSNFLKLIDRFVVINMALGMLVIAGLSLISLSPVSLEDYSQLKNDETEASVAGAFDSSDQALSIENLLAESSIEYNYSQTGESVDLSASTEATTELSLLKFINDSGTEKILQISFEYKGDSTTLAKLTSGSIGAELIEVESGIYSLIISGYTSADLILIRDVYNSYDDYQLRKEFSFSLHSEVVGDTVPIDELP